VQTVRELRLTELFELQVRMEFAYMQWYFPDVAYRRLYLNAVVSYIIRNSLRIFKPGNTWIPECHQIDMKLSCWYERRIELRSQLQQLSWTVDRYSEERLCFGGSRFRIPILPQIYCCLNNFLNLLFYDAASIEFIYRRL
jgi:hypothetical protein